MAMSMSARSRSAPALLSTLISGAGSSGFYPGTEVGEYRDGTAETFNLARADFDAAWKALLPTLTEADFQRWRDARDRQEIRDVGTRRTAALAKTEQLDGLPVRREV
jgi:hypothetical protein